ncbi:DMT family transporter [Paenibacillus glufosinatiresistens]|uniref:DMT family transporter n=1 Tax=Paenibacillus glufosinatiresistens TaxID=3070657 RepID=UPI00286D9FEF|nr:DMT family transporter [Paenibacillus sp. YX.27]
MITGILLAMLAGSLVSLQNVFNAQVGKHTGSWSTTALVLGLGFAASFAISLITEGGGTFTALRHVQVWHLFSGIIGVGVVFCLMQGMKLLSPTFAISIVLISQLGFALLWDSMGWMGLSKVPFEPNQLIGVLVIAAGIVVFKIGGTEKEGQR